VLSAVIHLDEAAPHCHILLLPLVDGRMVGNKLIGGRPQLLAMQGSFHETVAFKHGLRKAPARMAGTSKRSAAGMVLARLKETGDSALTSDVWATIRGCIESAPERFLEALGLVVETKAKALRTMEQIFTSPGKGPKREDTQQSNAIAFYQPTKSANAIAFHATENRVKNDLQNAIAFAKPAQEKHEGYVTVAFAKTSILSAPQNSTRQPAWHGIYCQHRVHPVGLFSRLITGSTPAVPAAQQSYGSDISHVAIARVKDDAVSADAWDEILGEFVAPVTQTVIHVIASRTKSRTPAVAAEPDDSYVERDDLYQPDFQESEEYPWQD
jgi:hypothetical protein